VVVVGGGGGPPVKGYDEAMNAAERGTQILFSF
jgi:hypothetical protein